MNGITAGIRAGTAAYRGENVMSDPTSLKYFSTHDARVMRYSMLWSFFENTAYDKLHKWVTSFKEDRGLYRWTRDIYNPSFRLAQFHRSRIWGGSLDPTAGEAGVLPIVTTKDKLRPSIAQLWKDSKWQANKDVIPQWGSVMGDYVIAVIDDTDAGRVTLQKDHPGRYKSIETDTYGNIKGYTIEEDRIDPKTSKPAKYSERVSRDGDNVVYRLFRDDQPHAWGNGSSTWEIPYGFVPLVWGQHNNVGLDFGWAEIHPQLRRIAEIDDQASAIGDYLRRASNPAFLLAGVSDPNATVVAGPSRQASSASKPGDQDGRQFERALYAQVGATATPLIANVDVASSLESIKMQIENLEREFPELRLESGKVKGDVSGRAIRMLREEAGEKVIERRASYDDALVRAQQMAIAIGGYRGYKAYDGFGLESYATGDLDHQIADRAVFGDDPLDKIEMEKAMWECVSAAMSAGASAEIALERQGWSEADITRFVGSDEYKARQSMATMGLDAQRGDGAPVDDNKQQGDNQNNA